MKYKDHLRQLPDDLWGLLTHGDFLPTARIARAREWLEVLTANSTRLDYCRAYAMMEYPDLDADELEMKARSYINRVRKFQEGVDMYTAALVLDGARLVWDMTDTPEPPPRIEGTSDAALRERCYYLARREYRGMFGHLCLTAGYNTTYLHSIRARNGAPSQDFLIAVSHSSGASLTWLLGGTLPVMQVHKASEAG